MNLSLFSIDNVRWTVTISTQGIALEKSQIYYLKKTETDNTISVGVMLSGVLLLW